MSRVSRNTARLLAVALAMVVTAPTASTQQPAQQPVPKPLGSDLVTGKGGEHGHPVQIAMHFGDGAGGFTMNMISMGSFSGHEVAAGDVNNDGQEDIVVVGANGPVFVGLGSFADGLQNGDLTPSSAFVEGPGNCCERTRIVRLADVNDDGNLDIAVTMWTKVAVKLGNGDGTFGAPIYSSSGGDARGMDLGDLDGDGKLDLVTDHAPGQWWLEFHKGNGDGSFQPGIGIANTALAVPGVSITDVDGDGDLDVVTGSFESTFKVFKNNGAASFTRVNVGAGAGILLTTYDLNGDGLHDVVTGINDVVTVTLTDGSGGFHAPASAGQISHNARQGAVGDFNSDGNADVAILAVEIFAGPAHDGELWILPGNGNGTFQAPYRVPGSSYRNNMTIAAANFKKPADSTAPEITPTVSGTLAGGWYTSDVTVSWDVSDPESSVTISGCDTQTVTTDTAGTTFTCTATSAGGTSTESVTIKRDTTGPSIASASASPSVLWPPNNKMVAVTVTVEASDAGAGLSTCSISAVDSNEGGSVHEPDVVLTGGLTMSLRAERHGGGAGRAYTAQITCSDASGNTSTATTTVRVPHDQGKGK